MKRIDIAAWVVLCTLSWPSAQLVHGASGQAADEGVRGPGKASPPAGREAVFGDELPESVEPAGRWQGYVQTEAARAYREPAHWSKARLRAELGREGRLGDAVKWKLSGRFDYDAAYDVSHFYPPAVREDQRSEFMVRETYVDLSRGDWNMRLGRQHVVWGEIVGTFVADVVSAKDMREFVLQDFGELRIPQWAARAEYFKNDFHAEFVWIPVPSFDRIGKPGADFYPRPLPVPSDFLGEEIPSRRLSNTNYGLRLSQLTHGWDLSGFYYHSLDASPTFYRVGIEPSGGFLFQPRHDKIDQAGGTVTKDLGGMVLKSEFVYTRGRSFNVTRLDAVNGLARQNTLDYAIGVDFSLDGDTRINVQFLQRVFFGHDPDIAADARESVASLFLAHRLAPKLEAEALFMRSLNRDDWMLRPQLNWSFEKNWLLRLGADILTGPPAGLFGRFNANDRVYALLRYVF